MKKMKTLLSLLLALLLALSLPALADEVGASRGHVFEFPDDTGSDTGSDTGADTEGEEETPNDTGTTGSDDNGAGTTDSDTGADTEGEEGTPNDTGNGDGAPTSGTSGCTEHNWKDVTIPATCTKNKVTMKKCANCGLENDIVEEEGTALGHRWSAWVVIAQETCVRDGMCKRYCLDCGEIEAKVVPATGKHVFNLSGAYVATRATCETSGTYEAKCTLCGSYFTYQDLGDNDASANADGTITLKIPARGHQMGGETLVSTVTCVQDGVYESACLNKTSTATYEGCSYTMTRTVDHNETVWDDRVQSYISKYHDLVEVVEVEPGIHDGTPGIRSYKCRREGCGYLSQQMVYRAPNAHDIVEAEEIVTPATCTSDGEKKIVCSVCGLELRTETIPATGHTPGNWKTIFSATCTDDGERAIVCSSCGKALETETIPAYGHEPGDWEIVTEATCTDDGEKAIVCSACGETLEREVISALGHNWSIWAVTKQPTCGAAGQQARACGRCGEQQTMTLPATGEHTMEVEIVKAATATEAGIRRTVCKVCGYATPEETYELEPAGEPVADVPPVEEEPALVFEDVTDTVKLHDLEKDEEAVVALAVIGDSLDEEITQENAVVTIVNAEEVLTETEHEVFNELSVKEQLYVIFSAIGLDDLVTSALEVDETLLTDKASELRDTIQQRLENMTEEEKEAFDALLSEMFPMETIVVDGEEQTFFMMDVKVETEDGVRYERYGFRQTEEGWVLEKMQLGIEQEAGEQAEQEANG